jgi:hypothetical protein
MEEDFENPEFRDKMYGYLEGELDARFNPKSPAYLERVEKEAADQERRNQLASEKEDAARLPGMFGNMLQNRQPLTIYGQQIGGSGGGQDLLARSSKLRGEAEDLRSFGTSESAVARKKKEDNDLLYNFLTRDDNARHRKDMLEATKANSALVRSQKLADRDEKLQEKRDAKLDKEVERFGKTIESSQGVMNALKEVENKMGFDLDNYDPNTKTVSGKNVDLPGASLPGLGRLTFYDDEAAGLKSKMAAVFNPVLKERSGSAVVDKEMDRLRDEFAQGKFNTEEQMISALKDFKRLELLAIQNRKASFPEEAVARYKEQGGQTFDEADPVPTSNRNLVGGKGTATANPKAKPKTVVQNGVTYTLNEATGEYE